MGMMGTQQEPAGGYRFSTIPTGDQPGSFTMAKSQGNRMLSTRTLLAGVSSDCMTRSRASGSGTRWAGR